MKAGDKLTKKPAKPDERVTVVNQNRSNGTIGATATPLAKDVEAWLARGWVRA